MSKLKVEIWSDVMCPFCYIGKRKFEQALDQFEHRNDIEIEWKSFQLAPHQKTDTSLNIHQFLARHKGISVEEAEAMNNRVTQLAKQVGLEYNFDKAIPANSMKAHRFSHLAKKHQVQNEAEELLFRSYFTEGKNTDDIPTLVELGKQLGLNADEIKTVLENEQYTREVNEDINEGIGLGLRGVPFFVFDRKYGVSGAQDVSAFTQTLQQAYSDWKEKA